MHIEYGNNNLVVLYCIVMEMISPWGNAMEILWKSYGIPIEFMEMQWKSYGIQKDFLWKSHGTPKDFLWNSYGNPIELLWKSDGNLLEFQ